jgi:hypothetical protein
MSCADDPLICFRAGAAQDYAGTVNEAVALAGSWTWNGTTTVLATDTSGAIVGDRIRRGDGDAFFEVSAVAASASVTIVNPDKKEIPVGSGAQVATPLDLSLAVDGTPSRPAILIFVWRRGNTRTFKKTSYSVEEIQLLNQTTNPGEYKLLTDEPDTDTAKIAEGYRYELAAARQDLLRSGAQVGTATVTAGSRALVGVGTAFLSARPGDIIHPTSGAVLDLPSRIIEVTDDLNIVTERTWSVSAAAFSFEIRRGKILPAMAGPGQIDQSEVRIEL